MVLQPRSQAGRGAARLLRLAAVEQEVADLDKQVRELRLVLRQQRPQQPHGGRRVAARRRALRQLDLRGAARLGEGSRGCRDLRLPAAADEDDQRDSGPPVSGHVRMVQQPCRCQRHAQLHADLHQTGLLHGKPSNTLPAPGHTALAARSHSMLMRGAQQQQLLA